MTTMTKERLLTIKQWRETYGPGSNVVLPAEEAEELARIALASLEAEPVAYIFKHPAGKLFWALTDESNKDQSDIIPVYAAHPVPVVPEEKPMPNPLKMYAVDAVAAIAEVRGWDACRAAMLHGAKPVSQTYKLTFEQWLEQQHDKIDVDCGCVSTEMFMHWIRVAYEAGNSLVTLDGWVMVPKEPTQAMIKAWLSEIANFRGHAAGYRAALEAAPQLEVNRG